MQHNEIYKAWFLKAEEDELSARAILDELGHPSTVCFLSQQIAEKYLKGFLVFHSRNFQKVHDLIQMETLIHEIHPAVHSLHEYLVNLNRYYIETRYPGDYPEFSWKDAKKAFEDAISVKEFVLNNIQ
ncbi:MAG: HEPN domain-containing protein [Patescibacteria group bacterium]